MTERPTLMKLPRPMDDFKQLRMGGLTGSQRNLLDSWDSIISGSRALNLTRKLARMALVSALDALSHHDLASPNMAVQVETKLTTFIGPQQHHPSGTCFATVEQ
jgi:hypothetical protein